MKIEINLNDGAVGASAIIAFMAAVIVGIIFGGG